MLPANYFCTPVFDSCIRLQLFLNLLFATAVRSPALLSLAVGLVYSCKTFTTKGVTSWLNDWLGNGSLNIKFVFTLLRPIADIVHVYYHDMTTWLDVGNCAINEQFNLIHESTSSF